MKNIHFFAGVLFIILSCEKSDKQSIVGTWETYRIEAITILEGGDRNQLYVDEETRAVYYFGLDGKYDDGGNKGIYEVNNNKITVYTGSDIIVMEYYFKGNDLFLKTILANTELNIRLRMKN